MLANAMLFATLGYAIAAAAFLLFTVLLLSAFRRRLRGGTLAVVTLVTAAWGAVYAADGKLLDIGPLYVLAAEFGLDLVWLAYLASLLAGAAGGAGFHLLRYGSLVATGVLLLVGLILEATTGGPVLNEGASALLVFGQIFTSLVVLINIEQLYSNARRQQRGDLKFLCLGLGALFVFDLLLYSSAIMSGPVSAALWSARGYLAAMSVPLIGYAVHRSPSWEGGIFVSRKIVFHSAALFGSAVYLIVFISLGQYVREFGGSWGSAAQVVLLGASILALLVLIASDTLRASMRVAIDKHFYESKYDYREEWLRLTDTLTNPAAELPVRKRAIKALADIVRAPAGVLWLRNEQGGYDVAARWNAGAAYAPVAADAPLAGFVRNTGWIIDTVEFRDQPARYQPLTSADVPLPAESDSLLVPLASNAELLGLMALLDSPVAGYLNYEDRDLLKAAGQQVASYLAQDLAMELLAENRQFEAYNRLTAYIMHDLKNIIAQQSLVVDNAQRHGDKPEFVRDAIETIRNGVARMRRVLEQLKPGSPAQGTENVELGAAIMKAVSECAARQPVPRAQVGEERVWLRGNRERLQMALSHAIRNAQDATTPDGQVDVILTANGADFRIEIRDNGIGMDEDFVRDRLFRPFDSTKGTAGMGIGAYQVRETLRQMGGTVEVTSAPGEGTTVSMVWARHV